MSYTSNPKLDRVRMEAVKLVNLGWTTRKVAMHLGYSHSSVVRWCQRVGKERIHGNAGIPTLSSRPKSHPRALAPDIVQAIIAERRRTNRCAEVVHRDLLEQGVQVSLSSVKRTLVRHEMLRPKSKWKRIRPSVPRPHADTPGDLVQIDTIHFVDWQTGKRFYIYTVIDLHTRWAHAEVQDKLSQRHSLAAALRAQARAGFSFKTIQSDNGPEFQTWFRDMLTSRGISLRHSRVRHSNDNAHVERFNRTIQDECLGKYPLRKQVSKQKLDDYLDHYNNRRRHMGIEMKRPAEMVQSY